MIEFMSVIQIHSHLTLITKLKSIYVVLDFGTGIRIWVDDYPESQILDL